MKHILRPIHIDRILFIAAHIAASTCLCLADDLPVNLATQAKVSASSQFSDAYRPAMAINNVIPGEFLQDQDWAVKGTQTGWFQLKWDQPVEASQVVYYTRVTSPLLESFKDYAVYLNGASQPIVAKVGSVP